MDKKSILLAITGLFIFLTAFAQQSEDRKEYIEKKYTFFFPAGRAEIINDYKGNGHTLETMINDLNQTLASEGTVPDSLTIISSTSPEGPAALNERLAIQRAGNTRNLLIKSFPQFKADRINVTSSVNDWSGMVLTLRRDSTFQHGVEILKVLLDPRVEDKDLAIRSKLPDEYNMLKNKMFDNMRTSSVTIRVIKTIDNVDEFVVEEIQELPAEEPSPVKEDKPAMDTAVVETVLEPIEESVQQEEPSKEKKPYYIAAKTNLLYDAAIVPNVGVEVYLGKNFSVAGNWMYSWWKSDRVSWYWRTYGGDLALRYWLGRAAKEKPLTGHHIGLYGQILTYDIEVGGRGYLGDRWSYGGGLEYGYSLPVRQRLNIDFTLGLGYLGGEFQEYLPIDGHYVWQVTKMRNWIGPTKLEVSLIWQLGRGNINKDKKGRNK